MGRAQEAFVAKWMPSPVFDLLPGPPQLRRIKLFLGEKSILQLENFRRAS